MSAEPTPDDGELDPVPASVRASAQAAFGAVDRSAALAELVSDSLDDPHHAAGPRTVVFAGDGVQVRVVIPEPGGVDDLLVVVAPEELEALEVHVRSGPECTSARTASGHWRVHPVPRGPVSLGLRRPGARVLRTAWTRF